MTNTNSQSAVGEVRDERKIRGSMGAAEIAFFTVASAGPLLVIAGFAPLAFMIGGVGAVGVQLLAGLALMLFSVGLTRMATRIRNAGAFYAYIGQGLGRPMGGGAAFLALFTYSIIAIGQLGAIAAFAVTPVKDLTGVTLPWPLVALAALAIVAVLGYLQISVSAKVLGVALLAEVGVLLIFAIPVLIRGGAAGIDFDGFAPAAIFAVPGAGAMFAIAFGAFIGFESTAIYSEEARDPVRTLPRAIYLAVGFLTVFYAFMMWVVSVAYGSANVQDAAAKDPVGLVFTAMENYVGHPAVVVAEILLISSAFASILAFHNTATRYIFALGREGLLPRRLAKVHPTRSSPYVASTAQAVLAAVLILICAALGADPYLQVYLLMAAPGVLAVVVLQAMCSIAIVVYFRRHRDSAPGSTWSTIIAPALSFVALSGGSWLIVTNFEYFTVRSGAINWVLLGLLPAVFAAGVARTLVMKRRDPLSYQQLTQRELY